MIKSRNRIKPQSESKNKLPPLTQIQQIQHIQASALALNRQISLQQEVKKKKNQNQNGNQIKKIIEIKRPQQQNLKQQLPVKQAFYTCRICLQQGPSLHANNQQQLNHMNQMLEQQFKLKQPKYLIAACHCQGTSGYVHQKCMIQWIDTQYKRTNEKQMKCQICLEQILYDRRFVSLIQCQSKNLDRVSSCNWVCFGSLFLILGVFAALEMKADTLGLNQLTKLTLYALIAIMSIAFFLAAFIILKQAFYKKKKQTVKIYSNDQVDILGIVKDRITHYEARSSTHRTQTNVRSARSVRSAQNIEEGQNQHERASRRLREQRSHRNIQQNSRNNIQNDQRDEHHPRSARNIRSARQVQSSRSIQIRSRNHLQEGVNET